MASILERLKGMKINLQFQIKKTLKIINQKISRALPITKQKIIKQIKYFNKFNITKKPLKMNKHKQLTIKIKLTL